MQTSKFQAKNANASKQYLCTANRDSKSQAVISLTCQEMTESEKPKNMVKASNCQNNQIVCATNSSCAYRKCDNYVCDRFECIGLPYLNPSKATMTKLVYDQYKQQVLDEPVFAVTMVVLEVQKEFIIDIDRIHPGTGIAPGSLVFGYNNDQTLDIYGGKAKSYNADFRYFHLKYHGVNQKEVFAGSAENIKLFYDRIISYYAQRGFQLIKSDTTPDFDNQFIYTMSSPPVGLFPSIDRSILFLSMKLIYGTGKIPTHVDLIAHGSDVIFVMDLYQPNQSLYENGHLYPIRIPITTDFCGEFHSKYDSQPIAYYDTRCNKLTIHVPETDTEHFLGGLLTDIPELGPVENREVYLRAFDGTFAVIKRDASNNLVASLPRSARYLIQESELITCKSFDSLKGELLNTVTAGYTTGQTAKFTGAVCPLMNGESSSADVYSVYTEQVGSYLWDVNPLQFPRDGIYAAGDNSATKLIENYGNASAVVFYDQPLWLNSTFSFTEAMLRGSIYPEQRSNPSITPMPLVATNELALYSVAIHEAAHMWQTATGALTVTPTEGWAVALETDPKLSLNLYDLYYRPPLFLDYFLGFARGEYSPMQADYQGFTTYGSACFWMYLREQFDENNQIMRRIQDIITTETLGPLLKSAGMPSQNSLWQKNMTGSSLALDQALGELYGKNYADIWADFSVSIMFIRNNTALPPQYRTMFPHWMNSETYVGHDYFASYLEGIQAIPNVWWDSINEDRLLTPSVNSGRAGQTFVRTLPTFFEADALPVSAYSFMIPAGTTYVNLTTPRGNWKITMVQFTSDGTSVGNFKQDPAPGQYYDLQAGDSHYFDMTTGFFDGIVKLVCSHYTLEPTGDLSDFFGEEPTTGSIIIERDGPEVSEDTLSVKIGPYTFKAAYTTRGTVFVNGTFSAPGSTMVPSGACTAVSTVLTGKIGVVQRSPDCTSGIFVPNALATGAVGALIITDDTQTSPIDNYNGSAAATKPVMVISHEDGDILLAYLADNLGAIITFVDPFQ